MILSSFQNHGIQFHCEIQNFCQNHHHPGCIPSASLLHLFKFSFLPLLLLLSFKFLFLYSKWTFPLATSKTHLGRPRLTSLQNRVTWNAFLLDCHVSHALILLVSFYMLPYQRGKLLILLKDNSHCSSIQGSGNCHRKGEKDCKC